MEEKITILQAYKAMFEFLRELYYREGRPENLGNFLSDLQLLDNGKSADPASWDDWLSMISNVINNEAQR